NVHIEKLLNNANSVFVIHFAQAFKNVMEDFRKEEQVIIKQEAGKIFEECLLPSLEKISSPKLATLIGKFNLGTAEDIELLNGNGGSKQTQDKRRETKIEYT